MEGERNFFEVKNLRMVYSQGGKKVPAVNGVSFHIARQGEALAIVGESGCGKSSLALAIQSLPPNNVCELSGQVILEGKDLFSLSQEDLRRKVRWEKISWIMQNPAGALNPVLTVGDQIREALWVHGVKDTKAREGELLEKVGLLRQDGNKYPHQLSGGMQQRAGIARALALNPSLVILDEPTSALDISRQGAIIRVLKDLQKEFACSYMFITHDIPLAKQIADFFAVMYAGRIVEYGKASEVLGNPLHPYTKALIRCVPKLESDEEMEFIPGEPPDLSQAHEGCPFRFRPAIADACGKCGEREIELQDMGGGHLVACHKYGPVL